MTDATEASDLPPTLANPARRALAGAGIVRLDQLTRIPESEIARLHGIGSKALGQLRDTLAARGASFADSSCAVHRRVAEETEQRFTAGERGTDEAATGRAHGRFDHLGDEMTETLETQQAEMTMPEPQKEHAWLHRLIGEWEHTVEAPDMPASSPEACGGTESVRSIGGLWIVIEGTMPGPNGDPAASVMSLGYDPQKGRFVGTWFGSMMTHLWVYNGFLDESERVLTLESEGPSFTDPAKMSKYRDIIELVSDDHRTMTGNVLGEDGQWHRFMTAHYRRKA